jgi:hypothetical protein
VNVGNRHNPAPKKSDETLDVITRLDAERTRLAELYAGQWINDRRQLWVGEVVVMSDCLDAHGLVDRERVRLACVRLLQRHPGLARHVRAVEFGLDGIASFLAWVREGETFAERRDRARFVKEQIDAALARIDHLPLARPSSWTARRCTWASTSRAKRSSCKSVMRNSTASACASSVASTSRSSTRRASWRSPDSGRQVRNNSVLVSRARRVSTQARRAPLAPGGGEIGVSRPSFRRASSSYSNCRCVAPSSRSSRRTMMGNRRNWHRRLPTDGTLIEARHRYPTSSRQSFVRCAIARSSSSSSRYTMPPPSRSLGSRTHFPTTVGTPAA